MMRRITATTILGAAAAVGLVAGAAGAAGAAGVAGVAPVGEPGVRPAAMTAPATPPVQHGHGPGWDGKGGKWDGKSGVGKGGGWDGVGGGWDGHIWWVSPARCRAGGGRVIGPNGRTDTCLGGVFNHVAVRF